MKKTVKNLLFCVIFTMMATATAWGKDISINVVCEPDGATVMLNGRLVATTTPAIITVDKKEATKPMIFQFSKDGYESKSSIISFTKKELKMGPVVYGKLAKKKKTYKVKSDESTLTDRQASQQVNRNNAGATDMEKTILRWYFDSDPRGARVFMRVISNVPAEVKNTNETFLMTTPYEETRGFSIPGLTYANSRNVTIEIKVSKRGYEDQIKRYNVRQAIDQQEISGFFELVPKEEY